MNNFFRFFLISTLFFYLVSCSNSLENLSPELQDGSIDATDQKFDKRLYAIGQFLGPMNCTATYIEVPNQTLDSPAYVITNGHCTNFTYEDNPIYVDTPLSAKVTFKRIAGIPEGQQVSFATNKIAYGTMKGTDLAIVELKHSNKELQNAGIFPLKIASSIPSSGSKIQTYGYPLSLQPVQLRLSNGIQGNSSSIAEFIWLWHDFYSNNFKNIAGGSSGSPVFEDLSKGIWGIINTTTIGGIGNCELGAPCEFYSNVVPQTKKETSYVLDIRKISGSFNSKGVFDITLAKNELEKPLDFSVSLDRAVRNFGKEQLLYEKLVFQTSNFAQLSYRIDPFESFDRKNNTGFSPVTADTMQLPYPQKEGFYVLSFLKNNQKSYLTFKMDFTAPSADLIQLTQNKGSDGYSIEPIFKYPEIVNYSWKVGPVAKCNCADKSDLEFYSRFAKFVPITDLPAKVCLYGYDLAGNESNLKEFVLSK
jgi:hypothetical protein